MTQLALDLIAKEEKERTGHLDLGNCGLTPDNPRLEEVWEALGKLRHLETLILSNEPDSLRNGGNADKGEKNRLNRLPATLSQLVQLKKLVVTGDGRDQTWSIRRIEHLESLIALEHLNLRCNQISSISGLDELNNLTWLDLGSNQINEISGLDRLSSLCRLDLRSNNISEISGLDSLSILSELNLSSNNIGAIQGLSKLQSLTRLDLRSNHISEIKGLAGLNNLVRLDLRSNQISNINGLDELETLKELNLGSNQVSRIRGLNGLSNLTILDLRSNHLKEIEGLHDLSNLIQLDLCFNQISEIKGLAGLNSLARLDLRSNQIVEIDGLDDLSGLRLLDLRSNLIVDLSTLSKVILKKLPIKWKYGSEGILLEDCPLSIPPKEIVLEGPESVRRYLAQLQKAGKAKVREAKLLLTGSGEVGKTSLRYRLNDKNKPLPTTQERTRQVEVDIYTFVGEADSTPFTAHIWDFGGQQIIHHFHRFFMNDSALYLLMTETSRDNDDFDYWLQTISLYGKDSPILFVQNKRNGMPRSLDIKPYRAYFNIKDELYNVNLLNNEGLGTLERAIQYHIQQLPLTQRTIPQSWQRIREALEALKSGPENHFVTFARFVQLCGQEGNLTTRADVEDVGQFLHKLGIILWYHDNPVLRQKVILQRHWATEGIFKLVFDRAIKETGAFNLTQAQNIWDEYPEYAFHANDLIEMMREFSICFPQRNRPDHYIIPALLPPTAPEVDWQYPNRMTIEYHYPMILPRGLVTYLTAEMYDYIIDDDHAWSAGVWLHTEDSQAKVAENRFQRKVRIELAGKQYRELFGMIKKVIDDIHRDFAGLQADLMIPCNCEECLSSKPNEVELFKYSDVLRRLNHPKKQTITCNKSLDDIRAEQLLNYILPEAAFNDKGEETTPKDIFISYAHKDNYYLEEIKIRLSPLLREHKIRGLWHDHQIQTGQVWDKEIERKLRAADIIILLISDYFWASGYIHSTELPIIQQRKEQGDCTVVPVQVRSNSHWNESKWSAIQSVPVHPDKRQLIPINSSKWDTEDDAWLAVVQGIRELL